MPSRSCRRRRRGFPPAGDRRDRLGILEPVVRPGSGNPCLGALPEPCLGANGVGTLSPGDAGRRTGAAVVVVGAPSGLVEGGTPAEVGEEQTLVAVLDGRRPSGSFGRVLLAGSTLAAFLPSSRSTTGADRRRPNDAGAPRHPQWASPPRRPTEGVGANGVRASAAVPGPAHLACSQVVTGRPAMANSTVAAVCRADPRGSVSWARGVPASRMLRPPVSGLVVGRAVPVHATPSYE